MPKKITALCALVTLLAITSVTFAHKVDKSEAATAAHESAWDGSNAQVGYVSNQGNTNSSMLNLGTTVKFKHVRWDNTFQGQFQYGKEENQLNKQYTSLFDQANLNLNNTGTHDNFLFANGNAIFTKFGPYACQTIYAIGYGRDWIKSQHFTLSAQLGPGYRRNRQQESKKASSTLAGTMQVNSSILLSKYGTITQSLRYDIATPYNYLQAVSAFTNKIVGHVAVQISYTITHYSRIPPTSTNTKKTDTVTNISLVYNF